MKPMHTDANGEAAIQSVFFGNLRTRRPDHVLRLLASAVAGLALAMGANFSTQAQSTNAPAQPADYSTFSRFIAQRNIFNPNRSRRKPNGNYVYHQPAARYNSFGLAGIMSYDHGESAGTHIFFDGTSDDYRKVVPPGGTIASFKVAAVTPDSVTLVWETNNMVLKLGQQLREDGHGNWELSTEPISFGGNKASPVPPRFEAGAAGALASGASDTNAVDEAGGPDGGADQADSPPPEEAVQRETPSAGAAATQEAPVSDVIRRLMELRAREEQPNGNRN